MGEDMTYLPRDQSQQAGRSHKLGRLKLLHSPHILWYFQAKLLAAKGPIHLSHPFSTHTTREMPERGLVPSTGRSYQVSNQQDPLQIGYRKDFSLSQRAKTGLESLLDQVVLLQRLHPRAQINL